MRFHDREVAREYERRLAGEGYPGNLLDAVMEETRECGTIIDVGAGTGFFCIPLVSGGHRVHAVEPSAEMLQILREKADSAAAEMITLHHDYFESWPGVQADGLICVHTIYTFKDVGDSLDKMLRLAGKSVVIMRADSGSVTLSDLLRRELNVDRPSPVSVDGVLSILKNRGIAVTAHPIEQRRVSRFADLDLEARYYCRHLGLGEDRADAVRSVIERSVRREGPFFVFESLYRDMMLVF